MSLNRDGRNGNNHKDSFLFTQRWFISGKCFRILTFSLKLPHFSEEYSCFLHSLTGFLLYFAFATLELFII